MYTLIFLFLLKNIDCGYPLEPPRRDGSNRYPQSMFWAETWKLPEFFVWKFSFLVVKFSIYLNRHVFVMTVVYPERNYIYAYPGTKKQNKKKKQQQKKQTKKKQKKQTTTTKKQKNKQTKTNKQTKKKRQKTKTKQTNKQTNKKNPQKTKTKKTNTQQNKQTNKKQKIKTKQKKPQQISLPKDRLLLKERICPFWKQILSFNSSLYYRSDICFL